MRSSPHLDALYERLRDAPAERIGIDRVAELAGMARSTIYLVFGSHTGLFDALGDDLSRRGGFDGMLQSASQRDVVQGPGPR